MTRKMATFLLVLMFLAPGLKAQWTGYIGFEALNLTAQQKATFIDGLKALGRANDSPYPNLRNHWRIRPDNDAIIIECEFDDTTVTADAFKNRVATLYGVDASLVTYTTAQTAYGPTLVYKYGGQNRIRVVVFGGANATWAESRLACAAYLYANLAAWEPAQ